MDSVVARRRELGGVHWHEGGEAAGIAVFSVHLTGIGGPGVGSGSEVLVVGSINGVHLKGMDTWGDIVELQGGGGQGSPGASAIDIVLVCAVSLRASEPEHDISVDVGRSGRAREDHSLGGAEVDDPADGGFVGGKASLIGGLSVQGVGTLDEVVESDCENTVGRGHWITGGRVSSAAQPVLGTGCVDGLVVNLTENGDGCEVAWAGDRLEGGDGLGGIDLEGEDHGRRIVTSGGGDSTSLDGVGAVSKTLDTELREVHTLDPGTTIDLVLVAEDGWVAGVDHSLDPENGSAGGVDVLGSIKTVDAEVQEGVDGLNFERAGGDITDVTDRVNSLDTERVGSCRARAHGEGTGGEGLGGGGTGGNENATVNLVLEEGSGLAGLVLEGTLGGGWSLVGDKLGVGPSTSGSERGSGLGGINGPGEGVLISSGCGVVVHVEGLDLEALGSVGQAGEVSISVGTSAHVLSGTKSV
mmetsp:Transcript_22663/g.27366  ORF Transcript_22663/g.27366 Transcript_22663/m.27366 type:complete len:470 (-) Transcript_22663:963-2372(-)